MEQPTHSGQRTTRRFRVCIDCGEMFVTVRSARRHQLDSGHGTGIDHITATVQE
jgi:hypothetical protein